MAEARAFSQLTAAKVRRRKARFQVLGLLMIGLLVACESEPERPADVMSIEAFAPILADIHLREQLVIIQGYPYDSAFALFNQQYLPEVYSKWEVDSAQLNHNYQYYLERPTELKSLYEKTLSVLEAREAEGDTTLAL